MPEGTISKYTITMIYDGEEEEQEEVFDTVEEAMDYAGYLAGCYLVGDETMNLSNPSDYSDDGSDTEIEYEINEIEEDDD